MNLDTFFKKCVHICILMFFFTLIFNFIVGLGVFSGVPTPSGQVMEGNSTDLLQQATKSAQYTGGFVITNLWSVVLLGTFGAIVVAGITRSTAVIGIYLFAYVFWAMYTNLISILATGGFIDNLAGFIAVGTAGMIAIFIAAVIGMLTGSG